MDISEQQQQQQKKMLTVRVELTVELFMEGNMVDVLEALEALEVHDALSV